MPYEISEGHGCSGDKPWAVYNPENGKKMGCHESKEAAKRQQKALYANVPDAKKEELVNEELLDEIVEEKFSGSDYEWRPFLGAVSFRELEELEEAKKRTYAIEEMNEQFSQLARNIMQDSEIEDKGEALSVLVLEYTERLKVGPSGYSRKGIFKSVKDAIVGSDEKAAIKRENGLDFPARDYAYAPDPSKPSTWRIRLSEAPGKITLTQLTRAAIQLRTEKTSGVPASALNAVRRRVRAEFKRLNIPEEKVPPSVRQGAKIVRTTKESEPAFSIWKSKTGQYYWMAIYSNKYRDDDNPPEIISEKSHKAFTHLANEGIVPMPELWHWHVKGTRWGVATHLDYVDGFALAIGTIDKGHERVAEAVGSRNDIGVSHGMRVRHILRNKDDSSVIDFHITHEISDLLLANAANKMTDFVVISKESDDMPLAENTKKYLNEIGLSEDQISNIENGIFSEAKAADEIGVESKEADMEDEEETIEEEVEESKEETDVMESFKEEVARSVAEILVPFTDLLKDMSERLGSIEAEAQEIRAQYKQLSESDELKIAKKAEMTPQSSIAELISQAVIGNKDAQIDGRSRGAQGPKQVDPNTYESRTVSSFLDGVIGKSQDLSQ